MKKIKITFSEKVPQKVTKVVLTEKTTTALRETKEGNTLLEIGAGKHANVDLRKFIKICRKVVRTAKQHKLTKIAVQFSETPFSKLKKISDEELISHMGQNFELANFEFNDFKTKPKSGWDYIEEIVVCGKTNKTEKEAFLKGQTIGEYTNYCRVIANTPGGSMPPRKLATEAKKLVKGPKTKVTVLSEKQMKTLKMEAILAVSRGSDEEAKLIVMEYWGDPKSKKDPIILCGKGITFDSGGLNIKPGGHMLDMHLDMSGGSAVIAAVALAAKLKLKKNIVGIVPAVENMPNGKAYRPGDIITTMSGKTIEIHNTDAEGRVVLADAITYAKKYNPKVIVDVATLTGAALVAVGKRTNAIMTPDQKLQDLFVKLGEESGDLMWPLPMWDEYDEDIKGRFADIANLGKNGDGGTITAGAFLKAFAKGTPWVHIDMAPRMTSIPSDSLAPGATGEPVRFFIKLFENY